MTRPGIEPQSSRPLANTVLIRPMVISYKSTKRGTLCRKREKNIKAKNHWNKYIQRMWLFYNIYKHCIWCVCVYIYIYIYIYIYNKTPNLINSLKLIKFQMCWAKKIVCIFVKNITKNEQFLPCKENHILLTKFWMWFYF